MLLNKYEYYSVNVNVLNTNENVFVQVYIIIKLKKHQKLYILENRNEIIGMLKCC